MTPERLNFLIHHCFRSQRKHSLEAHYLSIANFLHVQPVTLRRWLAGKRPIPRQVAIIMEIFHTWPEINAAKVNRALERGDGASNT